MNPPAGTLLCPVTATKANSACVWVVNGQEYQFCCPPCIDEFVRWAKESPEQVLPPNEYIK
jgi:YHS domain-containing protein